MDRKLASHPGDIVWIVEKLSLNATFDQQVIHSLRVGLLARRQRPENWWLDFRLKRTYAGLVELSGIEPLASSLRTRRSPS
jgi:hypothetical protein